MRGAKNEQGSTSVPSEESDALRAAKGGSFDSGLTASAQDDNASVPSKQGGSSTLSEQGGNSVILSERSESKDPSKTTAGSSSEPNDTKGDGANR